MEILNNILNNLKSIFIYILINKYFTSFKILFIISIYEYIYYNSSYVKVAYYIIIKPSLLDLDQSGVMDCAIYRWQARITKLHIFMIQYSGNFKASHSFQSNALHYLIITS